jgi:hypothetical protein
MVRDSHTWSLIKLNQSIINHTFQSTLNSNATTRTDPGQNMKLTVNTPKPQLSKATLCSVCVAKTATNLHAVDIGSVTQQQFNDLKTNLKKIYWETCKSAKLYICQGLISVTKPSSAKYQQV